jgi:hypothetical protein
MTHFAGTTFGLGNPTNYSIPAVPWGVAPYTSPFSSQPVAGYGINPGQPLQQVLQLLHIVPQQLQQLQFLQQQHSQQLQLLLQILPAQLQQLQQLIQVVPQQVQQLQQWQPFAAAGSGQLGFGFAPQVFGAQTAGQVM